MPTTPANDYTKVYRTLALIPVVLAATSLLNIVLLVIDLGVFGGPHHATTTRKILAAIIGDGLLLTSIVLGIAAYRSNVSRTAAVRCLLAYVALGTGLTALFAIGA
ncbi:hypothetical protein [Hamadaea tsunoensis]|uniref:hypothetical protein n=1 Tax=Hamadaea tsunoensis TaxID=53368 RepID=UPI0003F5303F|nr:hypothetical protein [Hamadaea tsunoensis]